MTPRSQRERLIRTVARTLAFEWHPEQTQRSFTRSAAVIVDDLFEASADGKAVERALRVLEDQERTA